jgi:phospholipid/cholesterol/gamma-HCH transport system permease protein
MVSRVLEPVRHGIGHVDMRRYLEFVGKIGLFALTAARRVLVPPLEVQMTLGQIEVMGWKSLPLVLSSGFALGVVLTLHTRNTLVRFGADGLLPTVQAVAFFNEIGPLVTGLLVAGRVGAGIGAQLANMRATEQIDAIEVLSIDSFKLLVIPRIIACSIAVPILTVLMDVAGLAGGYVAQSVTSHISAGLFLFRAFTDVSWATFIPPTVKTMVFGGLIGLISSYFGYTTNEGAEGVGRAAMNSVVISSLAIILSDVVLVKLIFFVFPETAA